MDETTPKYDPAKLWNTGTHNTTLLSTNQGDKSTYPFAFLQAAHAMAKKMVEDDMAIDIAFYPALYLFRHGIEVSFKELLSTYDYEQKASPPTRITHDLRKLWDELKPHLKKEDTDGSGASQIDYVEKVVAAIHQEDPNGEAARYHTDNSGNPTLGPVKFANTAVFEEMCALSSESLRLILGQRLETESALRQERGVRP